jgi:pimeloyl-ACP methyl ester carboxylesterase
MQRVIISLMLALLTTGCAGPLAPRDGAVPSLAGGVRVTPGSIGSSTGCRLDTLVYRADRAAGGDLVVLAHGFLRSQEHMQELAFSIAGSGVRVATLDFCNPSVLAGRHVQNARDMVEVARTLGARRVVYVGFSAGGLAALIAARIDPRAVGVLTLDLVDSQGLGTLAAPGLDRPLLGLAGAPSNCNAFGNGWAVFAAAPRARLERIANASHCDFEAPTDNLCKLVCQAADHAAAMPRRQIIVSATRAVHALLGGDIAAWPGAASPRQSLSVTKPSSWAPPNPLCCSATAQFAEAVRHDHPKPQRPNPADPRRRRS